MTGTDRTYRIMISGGGTGGHIYPAISIAQALKEILNEVEILFVGAKGKMEMTKVPQAGFEITGLWISGIQRRITFQNLLFPIKLIWSIVKSYRLLRKFKPDVVIGVGGYASGPLLYAASFKKIPTLIQEQNSYAGLTNKWLAKRVDIICVAYDGMERYFPEEKIRIMGNPVRKSLAPTTEKSADALEFFNFNSTVPTLLVIGGSLGARTINESMMSNIQLLIDQKIQVIWQTGSFYYEEMTKRLENYNLENIRLLDFVQEMHYAYEIADVVISRAGALSISELMLVAKPAIMVPSPNVAEDHQTKNAQALVKADAGILITDRDAREKLVPEAIRLLGSEAERKRLSKNIAAMAHPNAALDIANEIVKLVA